jgi:hypothetical protein
MNQCRSEGENSRVLIPCFKGKYGVLGSKFSVFLKKIPGSARASRAGCGALVAAKVEAKASLRG